MSNLPSLTPSEFVALTNQTLEYAYPSVVLEAEVSQFKVSQDKFVFFDAKDTEASVPCFMMVYALPFPLQDGMTIRIIGTPKLTAKGRFSVTVRSVAPIGEGTIKKGFELLKQKLTKAGLFEASRKRPIPRFVRRVGIITSRDSAGYADFRKITSQRLGGVQFFLYHVPVQGDEAAKHMVDAIDYFNAQPELVDALVLIRGGGSAEDLMAFNDERLVRAVAQSRIPIVSGIGHETDESLVDLASDVRAATPSNAAQLILPDKESVHLQVSGLEARAKSRALEALRHQQAHVTTLLQRTKDEIKRQIDEAAATLGQYEMRLELNNPERILAMGYALVRGELAPRQAITIETRDIIATAEVTHCEQK